MFSESIEKKKIAKKWVNMGQALSEMSEEFTVKSIREFLSVKIFVKIDQSGSIGSQLIFHWKEFPNRL